ncbi:MAG: hypothetical protein WCP32_11075, partial [Bacteroidota bacterium]
MTPVRESAIILKQVTFHRLIKTRDEGRGTRDEGRGTRDEGRGTRDEIYNSKSDEILFHKFKVANCFFQS